MGVFAVVAAISHVITTDAYDAMTLSFAPRLAQRFSRRTKLMLNRRPASFLAEEARERRCKQS